VAFAKHPIIGVSGLAGHIVIAVWHLNPGCKLNCTTANPEMMKVGTTVLLEYLEASPIRQISNHFLYSSRSSE
jgi:hypothetical protein